MSLKEAVNTAVKDAKTENHSTGKTPAFYTKRNNAFIAEVCTSPIAENRILAAGSQNTPTKSLKEMLTVEKDVDVLSVLLMNPRIPTKALEAFMDTPEIDLFSEEDEAYKYIVSRVGTVEPEPTEPEE